MIRIIENNKYKLIIKDYPTKYWLALIILTIFVVIVNYQAFFLAPIFYCLSCTKGWLNITNCEIIESSLFNKNLFHQIINHIHEPKGVLKNGTIWLTTEIDLLHNRLENIYYPSDRFLGFYSIYLYRFHGQALQELNQINDFIHSKDSQKILILTRKIFSLFYIPFLLLPLTIVIPIISIIIQPITTYIFDVQQNYLFTRKNILSTVEEKTYSLDRLKTISSIENQEHKPYSISINIKEQKLFTFNDFKNKSEALNLFNILKQYIK